ncbi:RDD family protein [Streptomyces physcomitrii]|uniref:RDD family protein n=1 Tax=Streptomyces physcomitrii TaxID=2724184 RepID=A0ABX1GUK4_9ACTN|nr:RDD family protein [Streptomyces physcomitrii]NKI39748.1 RDD family protein [Streptomyces physcomitrii]
MSTDPPPPGSGRPPEDDPFRKPPSGGGSPYDAPQGGTPFSTPPPSGGSGGGSPYGSPPPSGGGGPYDGGYGGGGGGPYGGGGGDPYGGGGGTGGPYGGGDPLAGMPPLADSGKRVLARLIDMILVGAVTALLSWIFSFGAWEVDPDKVEYGKSFGQSLLAAVLYIGYDTILTARTGQTLGKRLMKQRVANLDNGATPSVQTSLVRAAVLWLPFAFCCACVWTIICGGWSFFDKPYKQGLHDKAAKTVVVSTA